MPPLFSALFPQQQGANPLAGLLSLLPMLTGNQSQSNGPLGANLLSLLALFQRNLPAEELKELLVAVVQTIPRETLANVLITALANEQVREVLVRAIISSLDKISQDSNSNSNANQEQEKKNEEAKLAEQKRIEEQKEFKRLADQKRQEEEKKHEEEQQALLLAKQKEEIMKRIEIEKEKEKKEKRNGRSGKIKKRR